MKKISQSCLSLLLALTMGQACIAPVLAEEVVEDETVFEQEVVEETTEEIEEVTEEVIEQQNSTVGYIKPVALALGTSKAYTLAPHEDDYDDEDGIRYWKEFSFTPSSTGIYHFTTDSNSPVWGIMTLQGKDEYMEMWWKEGYYEYDGDFGLDFEVRLETGKKYYIFVESEEQDSNCTVKFNISKSTEIVEGNFGSVHYSFNKGTCVLTISGTGAADAKFWEFLDDNCGYRHLYTEMIIQEGITEIDKEDFCGCFCKVKKITLPKSLKKIGPEAFYGYGGKELTIPENVTTIAQYAFNECYAKAIYMKGSKPTIGKKIFVNCWDITVYTPKGDTSWDSVIGNDFGAEKITWLTKAYPLEYSIKYNLMGSDALNNASNPASAENTKAVTLKSPTRAGYKFTGWYNGDKKVTSIPKGNMEKEYTVTASWQPITYKITYTMNSGVNDADNPKTYTIEDAVSFNAPTRKGYTFEGWYTDSKFTNGISNIELGNTGNIKVYAKWNAIPYDIHYETNGGTNAETNPATYTIAKAVTLKTPTKAGYTFQGWYTTPGLEGKKVTSIKKGSTEEVSLYAKWAPTKYTITYVLSKGKNPVGTAKTYTVEDVPSLPVPTKAGYTFEGWYLDSKFTTPISTLNGYTKNLKLYAKWNK